jgi:hypothetical protein
VKVTTTCTFCGKSETFEVSDEGYRRWKAGAFIQDALPELSADRREQLISGTDPECWDRMFKEEE